MATGSLSAISSLVEIVLSTVSGPYRRGVKDKESSVYRRPNNGGSNVVEFYARVN